MKYLLTTFLLFGLFANNRDEFSIRVKIHACSNVKREYAGTVYLLRDGEVQDSVATLRYVNNLLFRYWKKDYDFRFRNLTPGHYKIKYQNRFNVDSLVNVDLGSRDEEVVEICFDKIPDRFFQEPTLLDKLTSGDTLRINCYIAAAGEFGGYDEGLWITKQEREYFAGYFSLPTSYGLGWDEDRIQLYDKERKSIKQIGERKVLHENQIKAINKFLVEIKYYRTGQGWSNAPEFFSIYSKTDTIRSVKIESNWKPYLELKQKI